jgi:hypothetical protein
MAIRASPLFNNFLTNLIVHYLDETISHRLSSKRKNPRTLSADPECREILDIFYDVQSSQSEVRGAKMHQNHGRAVGFMEQGIRMHQVQGRAVKLIKQGV